MILQFRDFLNRYGFREEPDNLAQVVPIDSVIGQLDDIVYGFDAAAGRAKFAGSRNPEVGNSQFKQLVVANIAQPGIAEVTCKMRVRLKIDPAGTHTQQERTLAQQDTGVAANTERDRASPEVR